MDGTDVYGIYMLVVFGSGLVHSL